jgi:hypothetical protein
MQNYDPTLRVNNVQGLYNNHFKFNLEALPDLTFAVQSVVLPSVISGTVARPSPLVVIQEPSTHLTFGALSVSYLVDAAFKSYYSIYWWMKGYGFPHTTEELDEFRAARALRLPNVRPFVRDIQKTTATLQILQPDTESIIAEVRFTDVFPISLGEITFETTAGDAPVMVAHAGFACTEFDVFLP